MFVRLTVVVVKKQFVLNIFECVFIVFFIVHENRSRLVIFSFLACHHLALSFTSFQIGGVFEKIKTQNIFLKFSQNLLEIFLTLRTTDEILC
jgi:hypothetical protein